MKKCFTIALVVLLIFIFAGSVFADLVPISGRRTGTLISTITSGDSSSSSTSTSTRPATSTSTNTRPTTGSTVTRPTTTTSNKNITEVKVTIEEPKFGETFDRNPVFETEGLEFDHISWEGFELTGIPNNWVGQNNDTDKAIASKYRANIFFNVKEGYTIKDGEVSIGTKELKIGNINGESGLTVVTMKVQPFYVKTKEYVVTQPEDVVKMTSMTIKVDEPKVGEPLPATATVSNSIFTKEIECKIDNKVANNYRFSWNLSYHPAVQAGTDYLLDVRYQLNGAVLDEKFAPTVNGKAAKYEMSGSDVVITYKFSTPKEEKPEETTTPKEPNWINKFSITVDAPAIGAKPSTKFTNNEKGYEITKLVWTPNDKEFKEGGSYTVTAFIKIDEDRTLRSDYFGLINGVDADMPVEYDKDDFYMELTFPKLDGEVSWASASKWAIDELNKAKDAKIIPTIFDKEDLTKNITRKEFAHVAVKLYEKISGKGAEPAKENPFTDTKDEEVLKAYEVGITAGMSATTFEPDTLITREQMATMMTRALTRAGIETTIDMKKANLFADDSDISSWAKESVYFMAEKEIIKGVGDNKFDSKGNATREASLLISVRSAEKFAK